MSDDNAGRRSRFAPAVCLVLGLYWLGLGIWSFVAPRSFADVVATFEPYNRHLVRDVGALQIGVGTGSAAAVLVRRSLPGALLGLSAFQLTHVVSHVMDRDLGGRPVLDIAGLAVLAVAGIAAIAHSADAEADLRGGVIGGGRGRGRRGRRGR